MDYLFSLLFLLLQQFLLFLPLSLGLFLKQLFILKEHHLFHYNSLIWIINMLEHLILFRELSKSRCLHIKGDVAPIKVIFIAVFKLGGLVHGLNHHWVGHIVF